MKKIKSPTTSKQIKDGVGLGPVASEEDWFVNNYIAYDDINNYKVDIS